MAEPENRGALLQWLQGRGYSDDEIAKILQHMADYDDKTATDSVFDSIGRGSQTIDDIIRAALGK
jgi:hypothetical protein